jgi:hypothetical protein
MNIALVNVTYALFLAFLSERLVEHFIGKPLEQKAPLLDRWWLIYVALVAGGLLSWFCGLNIFSELPIPSTVGMVLTALLVGGGSQLLHTIIARSEDLLLKASSRAEW